MTHLILVHNGDYSNFYSKLYSLFHTPDFLNSPFAGNSLIQLDLCLSSSKVTDNICASFIKILCSHTLRAPSHTINGCLAIVHNVLIRHPPLQSMIGLRQTASLDSDQQQPDPFNPIEMNPEKTNARESSLWEISTLTSHFLPSISKLALTFSMLKSDLSIWDIRKYVTLSHKEFFVTNLLEYRKTKELPFEYLQSESYLSLPPQLTQYVPSGRLWKSGSTILDNGTVSVIPSISKLKRESSSSMSDHPNADSHEQSLEKRISIVCSPYEPLF
ncbi:putative nucleolar forms a complex with nop14p [Blattamonas nauphoetae]|uniref:Nucleolar forms a complex with nop14p n=1 Tax=Blattamonas nauphoetae TaxID=2049346 RepID=A0ABQ9WRZ2_9EUKA|nr:putative nucleolar forms a complex with nop14p [Blattamonas nauphoetae]